jgi:ribosome maturation factor RimP
MIEAIAERVSRIAAAVAGENGVEYVNTEIAGTKRNMVVRVFVDKPEGVTIDDLTAVSRGIEAILDVEDFIPTAYVLEVSSPGLERGLFSLDDYRRFSGKKARVKTNAPINGQTNFSGRIAGVEGDTVEFEDKTNGLVKIPFADIMKANLRVDLAEEFKRKRTDN